ncbi:MAG TPA: glutamate ABC transporter substrate-binding protein [Actinomycetota bacterium]|nr:glutamate ABC transporter substrate-binding protein [Actinomycetota bacterium]
MRDPRRRKWWVVAVACLLLVPVACGGGEEPSEQPSGGGNGGGDQPQFEAGTTMAKLQDEGKVVIGVKYDVPPFGFQNPETGDVEGFDVDLGKIIASELGVEAEFEEAISDNRIPFLQDGTVDLILSTMTITTDRDTEIDYSRPYFIAHGRILAPKGSDIKGIDDLNGKRVCTALGSTYESTIKEQAPDADLELVDSYSECTELLQNESIDAISTDDVILTGMIIQDKSLELVGDQLTVEPYGIGIADGDKELKGFVDGVVDDFLASGEFDKLYEKWVGQYTGEPADDPAKMTLQEALKLFPCDETC